MKEGAEKTGEVVKDAAKDVKREAVEAGISAKSLRTAREALGIKPAKTGFEGGWVWSLPRCPTDPEGDRVL